MFVERRWVDAWSLRGTLHSSFHWRRSGRFLKAIAGGDALGVEAREHLQERPTVQGAQLQIPPNSLRAKSHSARSPLRASSNTLISLGLVPGPPAK
jgi:hypothetical protein